MEKRPILRARAAVLVLPIAFSVSVIEAADQPQWGEPFTRNMVSAETGLPHTFNPETGENVKWSIELGTKSYCTPVIADGKIYVGTNNEAQRDPKHVGDSGVLLCLDEQDGSLIWQLVVPKLAGARGYQDWPNIGYVSPVTVEGGRVYLVNNRNQVMCLDANGLENGNDGPFRDEGRHMSPDPAAPLAPGPKDADIFWIFDLEEKLRVAAHDEPFCSILIDGPNLYVCTSNGVDAKHGYVVSTGAPSLIVLDKTTGDLVGRDREPIGPNIVHSTWSSPALLRSQGRETIIFAGGNGVCYGFEPAGTERGDYPVIRPLKKLWEFDCDPGAPKQNIHQYRGNRQVSASNVYGMPVLYRDCVYITCGGDFWHGKNQSWIKCFRPEGAGDITGSAAAWSYPLQKHCMATPAIRDGLVFIGDTGGVFHCLDAETGEAHWTHDTHGVIWASPLAADGKVYVVNQRGRVCVFEAAAAKNLLGEIPLQGAINASPAAANSTLYITSMTHLFALKSTN